MIVVAGACIVPVSVLSHGRVLYQVIVSYQANVSHRRVLYQASVSHRRVLHQASVSHRRVLFQASVSQQASAFHHVIALKQVDVLLDQKNPTHHYRIPLTVLVSLILYSIGVVIDRYI